ncbi:MAG: arylsulfatase [Planctomycetota bacterium]
MHRYTILSVLFIIISSAPNQAQEQDGAPRPNIILIMSDDMGYSDLGCYGGEIPTPTLDALAEKGLRYTQFYNTGRCCPTRASLLTGLYAHQAGVGRMTKDDQLPGYRGELSFRAVTLAEVLKPAGYATYMSGKWHVTSKLLQSESKHNWPRQRGFDRFYGTIIGAGSFFDPWTLTRDNVQITPENDPLYRPEVYHYTDAIADNAVMFINDHAKSPEAQGLGKPFFLYVAFTAPHWPLHALPEDIEQFEGDFPPEYDRFRQARFERMKQMGLIGADWELSPTVGDTAGVPEDRRAWEARCMEVYAAMILQMDRGIGRIVEALKQTGAYENTLILYLHDNGGCHEGIGRVRWKSREGILPRDPMGADELQTNMIPEHSRVGLPVVMGTGVMPGPSETYHAYGWNWANVSNTPFRLHKSRVHEGGIATPLVAHWPAGIPAGDFGDHSAGLRHRVGHLIDIMPTAVELSGADYPQTFNGHDITPMEGRSLVPSFAADEQIDRVLMWEHFGNAAIRHGQWKLVRVGLNGPWELYDMQADRTEMHDLSETMPDKARALAERWEAEAERTLIYPLPTGR